MEATYPTNTDADMIIAEKIFGDLTDLFWRNGREHHDYLPGV